MPTSRSAKSGPSSNLKKDEPSKVLDTEVRAVLAEFPTSAAPLRFEPVTKHGGLSGARIWRVEIEGAYFALRQWPPNHPSPERLRFIHLVLEHTYSHGFHKIPVPLRTRGGESFVDRAGRLWEFAPWLVGENRYESEANREKQAAALRVLAQFHLASASIRHGKSAIGKTSLHAASPGLTDRQSRLDELTSATIDSLRVAVERHTVGGAIDALAHSIVPFLPLASATAKPILDSAVSLSLPLQPCLRDIWHGNLLFTGDEVTGIVDFGAMQVDSPALDVARLLGSMAGDDVDSWRLGVATYEDLRPLTREEHLAVRAADASGVVLGCVNWLRWLYVEQRQFGDLSAVELRINKLLPRLLNLAAQSRSGSA